jgi:hypothetical protein
MKDQRTIRMMIIAGTDRITSTTLKKRKEREMKRKSRALKCLHFAKEGQDSIGSESDGEENLVTSCISEDGDHEEPDLLDKPSTLHSQATRKQMRRTLPKLAKICDRFGSTSRAGAAIATAVLEDFGIVTKDDRSNVIDQYKLRRERAASRTRSLSVQRNDIIPDIQTLYFDGRRDKTLKLEKKGCRWYRKFQTEEHITVITEPGNNFLTHITPQFSTAKGISDSIIDYFNKNNLDLDKLLWGASLFNVNIITQSTTFHTDRQSLTFQDGKSSSNMNIF